MAQGLFRDWQAEQLVDRILEEFGIDPIAVSQVAWKAAVELTLKHINEPEPDDTDGYCGADDTGERENDAWAERVHGGQ